MRTFSVIKNSQISRGFDRTNMPNDRLWDIQNGYIDKQNNIQQRSGVAKYNSTALVSSLGTMTVTIATPAVISLTAHGLVAGDSFYVTTTGALPTGMAASTTYYVISTGLGANSFQFSATSGGAAINTSGSQSGTHTLYSYPRIRYLYEARRGNSGLKRMICRAGAGWFYEKGDAIWYSLDAGRTKDAQGDAVMSRDADGNDMFIMVDGGVPRMGVISSDDSASVSNLISSFGTCTVSIATPGVITKNTHGLVAGNTFTVITTGALPTGITAETTYYVISAGLATDSFQFSATLGGDAINTSGSQSGTHTLLQGTLPAAPNAVHLHNGHIIMNNNASTKESLVYVSAFQDAQDYTTAYDALTLDLRYVLPIADHPIGFATIGEDTLVIICKNYIVCYYAPEDTTQWAIRGIYETGGLTNYATVKHRELEMVFIPGLEDVNGFLEGGQVLAKERNPFLEIAPLYRSYLATLTSSNWKYITGGVGGTLNHYYIGFPLSAGHEILVFSFDMNRIVGRYTGLTMHSFCEREDGTILIGGNAGQVYIMNSGTNDADTAITFKISMPYYYLGDNERFKSVKRLRVPVSHTANLTLYADWTWDTQAGSTVSKVLTAVALGRTDFKTQDITGRGRGIAIDIYHSTKDTIISISQWAISFITGGIK